MFGKTKELADTAVADDSLPSERDLVIDDFFGDEAAAEEATRSEKLARRIEQVEQQLSSQFTSMAAYAQIAQEQVELARSESRNATERAERRVTELIERERADRLRAGSPSADGSGAVAHVASSELSDRIDSIERSVSEIRHGLNECLARQKALADAITALFEPKSTLPPPASDGPIAGLSIV